MNDICPSISGDKATDESWVKVLEAKQQAESKKALDDAKDSAALREKNYAERLASLTRDVGGELNLSLFAYFFLPLNSM